MAEEKVAELPRPPQEWRLLEQRNQALLVILAYLEVFGFVQLAKPFCASEPHTLPPSSRLVAGYPCSGTLVDKVLYLAVRPGQVYKDYLRLQPQDCWVGASAACMLLRMTMALVWPGSTRLAWASAAHRLVAPFTLMIWLLASGQEPSTLAIWFVWSWPLLDCTYILIFPTGFIPEIWYGVASFMISAVIGWRVRSLHPHIPVLLPAQLLVCTMSTAWALYVHAPRRRPPPPQQRQRQRQRQHVGGTDASFNQAAAAVEGSSPSGSCDEEIRGTRKGRVKREQAAGANPLLAPQAALCNHRATVDAPFLKAHDRDPAAATETTGGQSLLAQPQDAKAQEHHRGVTGIVPAAATSEEAKTALTSEAASGGGWDAAVVARQTPTTDPVLSDALAVAASSATRHTAPPPAAAHDGGVVEAATRGPPAARSNGGGAATLGASIPWGTDASAAEAAAAKPLPADANSDTAGGARRPAPVPLAGVGNDAAAGPVAGQTASANAGGTDGGLRQVAAAHAGVATAPRYRYRRSAAVAALARCIEPHAASAQVPTPDATVPAPTVLAIRGGDGSNGCLPGFRLQPAGPLPSAPAQPARYVPVVRIVRLQVKIHGADPEQVTSGYEDRISRVVAAAGYELESVYLRRGCIELVVDARAWPEVASEAANSLMAADTPAAAPSAANNPGELLAGPGGSGFSEDPANAAAAVGSGPRVVSGRGIGRGGAISRMVVLDVRTAAAAAASAGSAERGARSSAAGSMSDSRQVLSAEWPHATAVTPCDHQLAAYPTGASPCAAAAASAQQLTLVAPMEGAADASPVEVSAISAAAPSKAIGAADGGDTGGAAEPTADLDIDIGALIRALQLPDVDATDAFSAVYVTYGTEDPGTGADATAAEADAGQGCEAAAAGPPIDPPLPRAPALAPPGVLRPHQHGQEGVQSQRPIDDDVPNEAQQAQPPPSRQQPHQQQQQQQQQQQRQPPQGHEQEGARDAMVERQLGSTHQAATAPYGALPTPWVVSVYPRVIVTEPPAYTAGSRGVAGRGIDFGADSSGRAYQGSSGGAADGGADWFNEEDVRSDTASGADSGRGGSGTAVAAGAAAAAAPEGMVLGPFRMEVVVWWPDDPGASPSEHHTAIAAAPIRSGVGVDGGRGDCYPPDESYGTGLDSSHTTRAQPAATADADASSPTSGTAPWRLGTPARPSLDQLELLLRCQGHHFSARMVAVTAVELALAAPGQSSSAAAADAISSLASGTALQYSLEVPYLPARPGLLLVEAIGIAVVPVLLLGQEVAAAAELKAAVDSWYGTSDEVDDLLLDVATFMQEVAGTAHVSAAGLQAVPTAAWLRPDDALSNLSVVVDGRHVMAAAVAATAATPENVTERQQGAVEVDLDYQGPGAGAPVLNPRIASLGLHLLSFALRSGWTTFAALLQTHLMAATAGALTPPPHPVHTGAASPSSTEPWALAHGGLHNAVAQQQSLSHAPGEAAAAAASGAVTAATATAPPEFGTMTGSANAGALHGVVDAACPFASWLNAPAGILELDMSFTRGMQAPSGGGDCALSGDGALTMAHAASASGCIPKTGDLPETTEVPDDGPCGEHRDMHLQAHQQPGGLSAGGGCCCGGHGEHHEALERLHQLRLRPAAAGAAAAAAAAAGGGGGPAAAAEPTAAASLIVTGAAMVQGRKGSGPSMVSVGLNPGSSAVARGADGGCQLVAQVAVSSVLPSSTGPAADADAPGFREYKASWRAAPALILQWFEVVLVTAALCRLGWTWAAGAAPVVPTAFTAAVTLLATAAGVASAAAWVVLPRLVWVRFVDRCAALRQASNCLVKLLVGWSGWPVLPCFNKYETGLGVWLMEGVVLPGACMLSPAPSLLVALAKVPLLMRSWLVLGGGAGASHHSRTRDAVLHACGISCMSLGTAIACHWYLRQSYRRLQSQRQHYYRRPHSMTKVE